MSKRSLKQFKENQPESSESEENNSVNEFSEEEEEQKEFLGKDKLQELKEKDPDFYEFMLKNDPTLFEEEEDLNDEDMGWTLPEGGEEGETHEIDDIINKAKNGNDQALLQMVRLFVDCVKERQVNTAEDYQTIMEFAVDGLPELIEKKKGMFTIYMRGVIFALKHIDEKEIIHIFIDIISKNAVKYAISEVYTKCISALTIYAFDFKDKLNRTLALETIFNIIKCVKKDDNRVEKGFKAVFAGYMKACKHFSRQTIEEFTESQNMIKKISLMNVKATYNILFEFIKDLSIAIKNYNSDQSAFKNICSFGCIKTFEIIALCLKSTTDEKIMQLYHPFCQILCGILNFVEGNAHVPIILHFVKIVNMIVSPSLFVSPVPAILLAIEQLASLSPRPYEDKSEVHQGKGKKGKGKKAGKQGKMDIEMIDFEFMLTIQHEQIRDISFIISALEALLHELSVYFEVYKHSIAFPELTCQCLSMLKKLSRASKIVLLNNKINSFVQKLSKDVEASKQKRNTIDFGPFDTLKVAEFEQK